MNDLSMKCVFVVNESLTPGFLVNTTAVLGATIGKEFPEMIGSTVLDKSENAHAGIVAIPIPVLKANATLLQTIRDRLTQPEFEDVFVVDFCDVAQGINDYEEYERKMATFVTSELLLFGIGIFGNKKKVNRLTGSLPLLR